MFIFAENHQTLKMSDEELSPEEALLKRQRKEKKDLQGKIQGLKKTASKGDKKKKKEITEEIAKLEADLNQKHDQELAELKSGQIEDVSDALENTEIKDESTKKVSKAQKRRDKKAEKERERQEDIEKQDEENKLGLRHMETEKIKSILASRGLQIHEIPSDGDCLFAGISYQIQNSLLVKDLRKLTEETLLSNKEDFQPFLSLDDKGFEDYCLKMGSTPKWGGHVEISALSKALKKPIEVIQAEGPLVQVGTDEFKDQKPLILTYHRHYYGLGEHYNSVEPLEE